MNELERLMRRVLDAHAIVRCTKPYDADAALARHGISVDLENNTGMLDALGDDLIEVYNELARLRGLER